MNAGFSSFNMNLFIPQYIVLSYTFFPLLYEVEQYLNALWDNSCVEISHHSCLTCSVLFCCFPCDERWWLHQQLLHNSVVCVFASARKSIFLLEVLFVQQPLFMICREHTWAGMKLSPAGFSCIVLFNRTCPAKSAAVVTLQDLYYMYNEPWVR